MDRYTEAVAVNRANWDERVDAHVESPGYAVAQFSASPTYLSDVVTFDLPRLGDVSGLRGVHLQCHIGTDTVSLARLGASMTGLDFSEPAVQAATNLAQSIGADATFVQSDVYSAADVLGDNNFDLVFTGIGALGWLPSIERWADNVTRLLRPGGRLFIREGHPVLWSIGDPTVEDPSLRIEFPYFEIDQPTVWNVGGTYVATDREFTANTTHEWNHGIGQILTALLERNMTITSFVEHDSVPWEALPGLMVRDDLGEWRLIDRRERLPLSYTLTAVLNG